MANPQPAKRAGEHSARKFTRLFTWLLVLLAASALSGCVTLKDPEASQEYRADILGEISPGSTLTQTIVSRRPRLNEIQLWISVAQPPVEPGQGVLLELFYENGAVQPLASAWMSTTEIQRSFPVTFKIPNRHDPANQKYLLRLSAPGGVFRVYGRNSQSYAHGLAWQNERALQGDMAFRLGYDYDLAAAMQDLLLLLKGAWLIFPLLFSLWLPGNVLLSALVLPNEAQRRLDGWQNFAASIALSLSIIPLIFLWFTSANLRLSQSGVFFGVFVLLAIKAWQVLRYWRRMRLENGGRMESHPTQEPGQAIQPKPPVQEIAPQAAPNNSLYQRNPPQAMRSHSLALLGVFLLALGVRVAMVRDLSAPPWVDAVHHATITRLILEQGAIPASYQPYIPTNSAGYHPGFHTLAAVFTWLSGLEIQQAMLVLGQALNALIVPAAYLLACQITGSRAAAVLAALGCAVFTPMPAYLTSWGRYTQLTGLLILPAAHKFLALAMTSLTPPDKTFAQSGPGKTGGNVSAKENNLSKPLRPALRWLLLAAVACAGMFLVHYRVLAFFAFLVLAELAVLAARAVVMPELRRRLASQILGLGAAALAAILLSLPWWPDTVRTLFAPRLANSAPAAAAFSDFSWSYLTSASGTAVMVAAAVGLLIAIYKQRWFATSLVLWLALLIFSANLGVFGLPGASFINNTSVEIMLFLPFCTLAGYAVWELYQWIEKFMPEQAKKPAQAFFVLLATCAGFAGAMRLAPILNPVTILARQDDLPAIRWIAENIPADETVLINPFSWGYGLYAGNDGGYWITPLAGRKTLPPPVLYGMGDQANWDNVELINNQLKGMIDNAGDAEMLAQEMKNGGVRYLYIGARGGVFTAAILRNSLLFNVLYNQRNVWLFEVK